MIKATQVFSVLVLAASLLCGCSTAEREEWNRAWSKPWFGRSSAPSDTEEWTIECNAYEGPHHQAMADRMATLLKRVGSLHSDQVWVEKGKKRSRVFYGVYRLRYVEAQTDQADHLKGDLIIQLSDQIKHDLEFIRRLAIGQEHPFFSARPIRKPIPDVGPAKWNLQNATGVYTLNVGVTYNTATLHNYKEAAVEWVRDLRARGYDAYYYHDPDKPQSSICVGTFGDDALVRDARGRTGYGPAVKALQRKARFKFNMENGHVVYKIAKNSKTGRKERIPNYSFLVRIPSRRELAGP